MDKKILLAAFLSATFALPAYAGKLTREHPRSGKRIPHSLKRRMETPGYWLPKKVIVSGKNFSGFHFTNAILKFRDFRGSVLCSIFEKTSLEGADLRGANLDGAQFLGALDDPLTGALFDDNTQMRTLLQSKDGDALYSTVKQFAFAHNMIRIQESSEQGVDTELEGGVLEEVRWDEGNLQETVIVNVFRRSKGHFRVLNPKITAQIEKIPLGSKIKVGLQNPTQEEIDDAQKRKLKKPLAEVIYIELAEI